jgi:hypothetical protein
LLFSCVVCLAAVSVDAAVIEVEWNSIASEPNETGLATRSQIMGVATRITGFASLEGIDPSRLTYEAGHSTVLEQAGSPSTSKTAHVLFGGTEDEPAFWDFFLDGNLIATGTDPAFTLDTEFVEPDFPSVWRTEIPVTGSDGTEFYQEVLKLTGGKGTLRFASDTSKGLSSDGYFNGTGKIVAAVDGDFNYDGLLDAQDIDELTRQSALGTNNLAYDLTRDRKVKVDDITAWITADTIFKSWVGDANLDREFNSGDLVTVLAAGAYEADIDAVWSTGDFNGDGRANTGDLVLALSDGGYETGPRAAVAAVPEPSGLMLLPLGLLGFYRFRK